MYLKRTKYTRIHTYLSSVLVDESEQLLRECTRWWNEYIYYPNLYWKSYNSGQFIWYSKTYNQTNHGTFTLLVIILGLIYLSNSRDLGSVQTYWTITFISTRQLCLSGIIIDRCLTRTAYIQFTCISTMHVCIGCHRLFTWYRKCSNIYFLPFSCVHVKAWTYTISYNGNYIYLFAYYIYSIL